MKKKLEIDMPVAIREVDPQTRTIEFVASDETVDRYNTIISVAGWDLANFRRNPVFLFGHDYRSPWSVMGTVPKIVKDRVANELNARSQWMEEGINPVADMVYKYYSAQPPILKTVSVGFIPMKWEDIKEGEDQSGYKQAGPKRVARLRFTQQELLELSGVIIPANPSAKKKSIDEFLADLVAFSQEKGKGLDPVQVMAVRAAFSDNDERKGMEERTRCWIEKNDVMLPCACHGEGESMDEFLKDFGENDFKERRVVDLGANKKKEVEDPEDRAGAVLNRKNKKNLAEAQQLIQRVLDSAEIGLDGKSVGDDEDDGPQSDPVERRLETVVDILEEMLTLVHDIYDQVHSKPAVEGEEDEDAEDDDEQASAGLVRLDEILARVKATQKPTEKPTEKKVEPKVEEKPKVVDLGALISQLKDLKLKAEQEKE